MIGLGIESGIVVVVLLGYLDADDLEREETAVAGAVGEIVQVVARGTERGDMLQVLVKLAIGTALVDGAHRGKCLELVELALLHVVNLFETDESHLGKFEEFVLGDALVHQLQRTVLAQFGRQQVTEEGALVLALTADEDEYLVVDFLGVEESCYEPHEPLLETTGKVVVLATHGDHRGYGGDVVGHAIPLR